jgi:TatD DNase family protein
VSDLAAPSGTRVVDTHCHLDDEAYGQEWPALLDRAQALGVAAVVVPATHLDSAGRILQMAGQDARVLAAVGIHPHEARRFEAASEVKLRALAAEAVALGETGLDFHYDFSPRHLQLDSLRAHLRLARELGLPVILHCREAEESLYEELRRAGPLPASGVVHCFASGWDWGRRFLDLGLYLGITGMVTFPRLTQVHEVARRCPSERLLLETDGPYLAPTPYRGRRNEPAHLPRILARVAELRGEPPEEVARASTAAARALFGERIPTG